MELVVFGIVLLVSLTIVLAFGTAVLCAGLVVTGEVLDRDTITKAGAIVLGTIVIQFVPLFGLLLSPFVGLACIMSVFEKTWGEALIVGLIFWLLTSGLLLVMVMLVG